MASGCCRWRLISQVEEGELLGREQDQVFAHPLRAPCKVPGVQKRCDEVALARRVDAVGHHARETEARGKELEVEGVTRSAIALTERQLIPSSSTACKRL